jgi:hypothetical protein
MHLKTVRVASWPPLGWLAVCPPGSDEITCYVGDRVEGCDGWICEGAWAGPFADGAFDETDLVFGSGVRARGDRVVFVPAGSPIDRLHSIETEEGLLVSNSLAALLAWTGGALRLDCQRYRAIFSSLIAGMGHYERDVPTTVGPVQLTYFDNLVWDGAELRLVDKPFGDRDLATYATYRAFLDESVQAVTDNARDGGRRHPFGLIATVSSGYDSTATAALARQAGCTEAVGFDLSKGGLDDSGAPVAEALGMRFHRLETTGAPNADVLFLAAGSGDGGDSIFSQAAELFEGKLVFYGHWGDRVWGLQERPPKPDFLRVDTSGTDQIEFRLVAGCVQFAVPFIGGRQLADILAISHEPELAPWDIGGSYNRPLARRILEEAGVPRDAFGMKKRALFVGPPKPGNFLTPELRTDYFRWLRDQRWRFLRAGMVPPSPALDRIGRHRHSDDPDRRRRLHRYVTHWALDRTAERYPRP